MHVNCKVNPGLEKKLIVTIILVRFFNCFVWFTFVLFVFRPISLLHGSCAVLDFLHITIVILTHKEVALRVHT